MGIFGDMINYIIDMGASAMLPLVIAILSIIVGVKIGKAVRAGLMVGVGFVGLGLIVDMMNANLGPAAQQMSEKLWIKHECCRPWMARNVPNHMGIKYRNCCDSSRDLSQHYHVSIKTYKNS